MSNTYIVYASDNGFHLGLHRLKEGKDTAFEEDIRIPLAVRGPDVPKGQRISAMVLNIDFAPTFADMAGVQPPDFVDGRSFMPLLEHSELPWRQSFMMQRLGIETDERLESQNALAIRTTRWTYVAYNNGEQELYDLERDPDQLNNIIDEADPALIEALTTRLIQLRDCAGEACRTIEDAVWSE
jgi:N-acetylglucosamine-6-sulfatase